jgi:hypothetical protein
MWKKATVGAAALMIAGSMVVYAQQGSDGPGRFGGPRDRAGAGGWHPSAQDMSAFADARIAALHAGLALNADQEKNWPTFEQSLHELSKMRIERFAAARDQQPSADPIDRLHRRADAMTTRGAALKRLADAAAPLYQSLDDAQKRRFGLLARFLRSGGERAGMGRGRFGGDGMDRMRHMGDRMNGMGGFHMGGRRFEDGRGMRNPHGMMGDPHGRADRDEEDDYRGPL